MSDQLLSIYLLSKQMDCQCKTNSNNCNNLHDIEQPNIDQTEAATHRTTHSHDTVNRQKAAQNASLNTAVLNIPCNMPKCYYDKS